MLKGIPRNDEDSVVCRVGGRYRKVFTLHPAVGEAVAQSPPNTNDAVKK